MWSKMEDILAVRNDLRLQNWTEVIRAKQESGLTKTCDIRIAYVGICLTAAQRKARSVL